MAEWHTCYVVKSGPAEDGEIYIRLTPAGVDPTPFPEVWFRAVSTERKEMLATSLAAIQTGFPVEVALEGITEYSVIDRLYLIRQPGYR